jgi:DNA-directed RNA polymerase subunit L
MEMLPINVHPSDAATIKDAKIEIRILPEREKDDIRTVTTDDFTVESVRGDIIMKDRDIGEPLLFVRVRKGESLHMKGRLTVENEQVSQVCTATSSWHIDPELVKGARKDFVDSGQDVRIFDNTLVQRYYSRDARGRPNWFDFSIESVGVLPALEILGMAVTILRNRMLDYVKEALENIQRETDVGTYSIAIEGGHTIGYLMQEVMYSDENVNFVSYDIPHPLKNVMVLRFNTKKTPESILKNALNAIEEYCSVVEKGL